MRLFLPAALILTACADDTIAACTDLYAASIFITPVDDSGEPIPDAWAEWRVADSGDDFAPCDASHQDSLTCAFEQGGSLEIRIDAWGYSETTTTVDVAYGDCHVLTETLDLPLEAVGCTGEVVSSVLVTVVDETGAVLTGATVTMDPLELGWEAPGDCEEDGDAWVCGEEIHGEIAITASHPELITATESVVVSRDDCHVTTELLTLTLTTP